jgi:hypothetical protein
LKAKHVRKDPSEWIRQDDVFPAIIDQSTFARARAIIDQRSQRLSNDEMLSLLGRILNSQGRLSGLIIDEFDAGPSSSAYQSRFGSLLRAYSLVGYMPKHDYRYLDINRALRRLHPTIVQDIIAGVQRTGGHAIQSLENDLLTINEEFTISIVIARCVTTKGGSRRWKIRLDEDLKPDITICVRMDDANLHANDFYILPRMTLEESVLRLADHNGLSLDAFRYDTLDELFILAARTPFRRAA